MSNSAAPNQRWWKEDTVAVVTGANKGIGYSIVRQLAGQGMRVILTARDQQRGNAAAKSLNDQGFHNVVFHQLDVKDAASVHAFARWMKDNYGKIDILVNNAGVNGLSGNSADTISENYEVGKECIDINYYGTKRMVEAALPLLKLSTHGGGRIVNVSSSVGLLHNIPSPTLRQQMSNVHDLREEKIDAFLQSFLSDFRQGLIRSKGWPVQYSAYFISKVALNAYTRVLARQYPDMNINCVHPGFVSTDLNFHLGMLSSDEGAKSPVTVALLPLGSPSGKYYDRTRIASF